MTDTLHAQFQHAVSKSKTIVDRADAEGRDLTQAEQIVVERNLAEAKSLRARIAEAKATKHTLDQIRQIGEGAGPRAAVTDRRVKALGGSAGWGDKLVRSHSDAWGGFKSLTPSGQINVSVPLYADVVRMGEPVLALRQVIPIEPDTVGHFSYLRQTVRTDNAAVVAPGALKPTSVFTVTRVDDRSRTIATLSEPVARQDLADAALLSTFLDLELRLAVETALEAEIIGGDGTGDHFFGLASVSGVQTQAAVGTDPLATIRKAITKLEVLSLAASAVVLHPSDWEAVETVQNNEGTYFMGADLPVDRASRRVWGVPVVVSTAATAGTAYVADLAGSTRIYLREEAVIDWSENTWNPDALGSGVGASDFARNLIRFRCEMRAGFAVLRPAGIVKTTLPS